MRNLILIISIQLFLLSCSSHDDNTTSPHQPSGDNPLVEAAEVPRQWKYIPKTDMFSRDGNTTGYLASLNENSTKIVVYLVGGGACFNAITCNSNPSNFDDALGLLAETQLNQQPYGWIDRNDDNNMFADWNQIIIPYSTGDVHSGTNENANVPHGGPSNQKMTGYTNFTQVVEDLRDYYGTNGITEFVVTGSSAGGFGTYLNFIQMAESFPHADMTGLVDAGPMFIEDNVWRDCLGETWTTLWDFEFPDDLDQVVQNNYSYDIQSIYEYLALKYPDANFGLISDIHDSTIRFFYGFGQNDCNGQIGSISADNFETALMQLRTTLNNYDNWNVYYVPDDGHTFLGSERYQTISVNGFSMVDWIEDVTQGTATDVIPN